ncbi:hypothetical protein E3O42_08655 [Cryobacterium adonitolivorans]|uniref:Uncharacterized protein n=1 Tax=Cryobacterium adonitolivorans TaxID=1259189 RepID=A0A4R8W558_9MICO|nr:hypothetical protein [Cryobacterium adonitolivorans]TFC02443.1 hypothetical protein E3O42_08655 [Cryobacterium adonitolivorans]
MFHNSPSAPDTALPKHASVTSAETHTAPVLTPISNGTVESSAVALADVEITELSPTEWRVADHAIEQDDPTALLGFIQIVGSAFEVTNLGRPRERAYFTSFDRATASLLTRGVLA